MGARGERRSENDPSQSNAVRATKGNIRCGPDTLDQPSPGGVVYSPCAGEIAGASKPAVGLRLCPRLSYLIPHSLLQLYHDQVLNVCPGLDNQGDGTGGV